MKRKILIISLIAIVLISLIFTINLTAGKNKWTIINTQGHRIWLVSDFDRAVIVRWDYYMYDGYKGEYYLTYSETVIQPGEDIIMPYTKNIYLKVSSDKVKKVEGSKIEITNK